jgi:hypothetical protein
VKPAIREAVVFVQTETERRAAWQHERGEDVDNPILLETRMGEGYAPGQTRSTLQCCVRNLDPELGETIMPSSVRSSYATWKFQAYKPGHNVPRAQRGGHFGQSHEHFCRAASGNVYCMQADGLSLRSYCVGSPQYV